MTGKAFTTNGSRRLNAWLAGACVAAAGAAAALSAYLWVHRAEMLGVGAAAAAVLLCTAAALLSAPLVVSLVARRQVRWKSPVTKPGAAYIALVLMVAGAAVYSGSNLIYLVLSVMLAAMLVSGLISRLNLSGLQLRLALPSRLFAGRPALARVAVKNLKRWMPSMGFRVCVADDGRGFELEELYFPYLAPGEELSASSEAKFARRGRRRDGQVALETRFPFGFVIRRVKLRLNDEILVYPSIDPSAEAERILGVLSGLALGRSRGDSHDLHRIRPAAPGDSARFVHWKASARGGELWVREFASDDEARVRLIFDRRVGSREDASRFERQVDVCAAVAWRLHEARAEVTLLSDERAIVCRPDGGEIFDLLAYLALVEAVGADGPPPQPTRGDEGAEYRFTLAAGGEAVQQEPVVHRDRGLSATRTGETVS